MNKAPEGIEALGERLARDVARQQELEGYLNLHLDRKRSFMGGAFRLIWAVVPGALVIAASDLSYPSRAVIAVAVSIAFGAVVEYVRIERRLDAAIQLLLLLARKK